MAEGFNFSGGPQFGKTLQGLVLSKQRSVKLKMLLKAGEPIKDTAEHLVAIGEEAPHLVDHILMAPVTRVADEEFGGRRKLDPDEAVVAIGPWRPGFYSFWLEFGTAPHGTHPGTPAQPFMRPAWDQHRVAALKSVQEDIWAWIRNHVDRGAGLGRTV